MGYILLYWGALVLGYFIGSKNRDRADKLAAADKIITVCVTVLVILMGIRMGSNDEVISNLGSIGIKSVVVTMLLMIGAVLAVSITRKIFKMDKYALLPGEDISDRLGTTEISGAESSDKPSNLMTWLILISIIIGILAGYFYVRTNVTDINRFNNIVGIVMTALLVILLLIVGLGLGVSGMVIEQLKVVGVRVVAFPIAILIGTTAAAFAISLLFGELSIKESLAISYGFGWYTFAPISISNAGYEIAGAISFMHNIFREMGGLVLLPLLASKIGYIESASLPGVASMDIGIPIIEKVCRPDIIVYGFTIGIFESLMVPLLVPLVIGM